jgi:hypothetical protein
LLSKFGLGGTLGFEDIVKELFEGLSSCDERTSCFVAVEDCRGLGGGGGLEADCDDTDTESPDVLRKAVGFFGGGGADLILIFEAFDGRLCSFSTFVSVLTRRGAGGLVVSSSDVRSIKFGTGSAFCEEVTLVSALVELCHLEATASIVVCLLLQTRATMPLLRP